MIRPFWFAVGLASLSIGVVGAFMPLLPTTPFLLLSAYAFAKSSPRLYTWLLDHPTFGPAINNWRLHRAIGRRAKISAFCAMAATVVASLVLGVPAWILAVQTTTLLVVATFIVTRPSPPD